MILRIRRSVKLILAFLSVSLLLSGCWERRELNELAFVVGMGLDKAGSGYKVSFQTVIPSSISSQQTGGGAPGGVPVAVSSITVPTIYEAEREYTLFGSRQAYFGHIRVLVIGEELARSGIADSLDVFKRSKEPRNDFYVLVARGDTAENVLKILTPIDKIPASKLFYSLDKSYRLTAKTAITPLNEFIEDLISVGKNPIITGISILGNTTEGGKKSNLERSKPKARLFLNNVAVFRKDRLIGWLDDAETIGYNLVTDNVEQTSGFVLGDDQRPIVIEALQSSTERKVKLIDGEPHIYVHVTSLCNVQDTQSTDNLESEKVLRDLERKVEERLVERMKTAVERIIERYDVDVMGFGQTIYQQSPKVWKRLEEERQSGTDSYLNTLPIHYSAKTTINRIGVIDKSFIDDIKE